MIKINGVQVDIQKFKNGESFIDLAAPEGGAEYTIQFLYESDAELLYLKFIKDHLETRDVRVKLSIPYFPYSRMDRQEDGRLFTLKSVCTYLNSLNFAEVEMVEPHSDVSTALLDRVKVLNVVTDFTMCLMGKLVGEDLESDILEKASKRGIYLVYPDGGASKRYQKQFKYANVLEAYKQRDFKTGQITSIRLTQQVTDCKIAIIVDDLCSKGGTFQGVIEELAKQGITEVYLVVAHCENTVYEGDLLENPALKGLITTNSILKTGHPKITIYAVE